MKKAPLAAAAVSAAAVALAAPQLGCGPRTCDSGVDCNLNENCSIDGICVEAVRGQIELLSPKAGEHVDALFDARLRVTFTGARAELTIDRGATLGGDPCAPFVPRELVIEGKGLGETTTTEVTVPGLRALGTDFHIAARLTSTTVAVLEEGLHGPPSGYDGAVFQKPIEHEADASSRLTVPLQLTFDQPAARATLFVEPFTGVPSPRVILGTGLDFVNETRAPLVRGAEIIWVELDDQGGGHHRCGTAMIGRGGVVGGVGVEEEQQGLELGLSYVGVEAGQLNLRVLVDREDPVSCRYEEPGDACAPVFQTRAPSTEAEETLLVAAAAGDAVHVAVVPGAAGAPMTAMIRVSMNGTHVGYFGPFTVNPALGESWVAGIVGIDEALGARLTETDELVEGAPF